ncbi:hypothetical protein MAR_020009 [Mya arenaria]|uniref:Uncharacterized protein n=1 Tax=Mya arenaria TaxID=6604 RepID=A0ABY7E3T2_MYAAR|nr:hypothetical protein MAR_020009 [Mya arenaria]
MHSASLCLGVYLGGLKNEVPGNFKTHFVTGVPKHYTFYMQYDDINKSNPFCKEDNNINTSFCKVNGVCLNFKNVKMNYDTVVRTINSPSNESVIQVPN